MLQYIDKELKKAALSARDYVLDQADLPYHQELFIKAHTGGAAGDGVIRELPESIMRTIKRMANENTEWRQGVNETGLANEAAKAKQVLANPPDQYMAEAAQNFLDNLEQTKENAKDVSRSSVGELSLYDSGNREAWLGLGRIGLWFDKDGNVLIKDNWKVDGSEEGRPMQPNGKPGLYGDLAEGGYLASEAHDLAKSLGTYKNIPIEIRLTREQWEAIQPDERQPTSDRINQGVEQWQGLETRTQKRLGLY